MLHARGAAAIQPPRPSHNPPPLLFGQGDSTQRFVKDLDVVLGGPAQVLILDDTAAVWPRHGGNLLPINRYIYFRACAERFAAP